MNSISSTHLTTAPRDILKEEYDAGKGENRGKGIFAESGKPAGGKLLGIIVGPVIGDRCKPELSNLSL